jgi:anti-sigma regulatory factor (Ser/Thr protein kinase)
MAAEIRLALPATHLGVRTLDAALMDLLLAAGVDEPTRYAVELAVHEVGTNIVEHAYGDQGSGQIDAHAALDAGPALAAGAGLDAHGARTLLVKLEDSGRPFDAAAAPAPNLDVPQEGGYGLFLAHALMDTVTYTRRGGRNIWHLSKRV